jgi:hypothetical protein
MDADVIELSRALQESLATPDPSPVVWTPKAWVELERGQGVWADEVDEAMYFKLPLVSRSRLEVLRESPALFFAKFLAERPLPDEDTKALRVGRYAHCATLQPKRWVDEFVGEPAWRHDGRTKDGKAERAAWHEQHTGRVVVKGDEYDLAMSMTRAIYQPRSPSAEAARRLLVEADAVERVAIWRDKVTGVLCRARIDAVTYGHSIADLKTGEDVVSLDDRAHTVGRRGYHRQGAMYVDAVEAVTGERLPFADVWVGKSEPHEVAVDELDEYALEAGRRQYRMLLADYDRRVEFNDWLCDCERGPQRLSLPGRYLEGL